MANHLESETEPDLGGLVAGIMQDARQLIVQQLNMFEVEVKNDVDRVTAALVPLVAGMGVLLAAFVLLGLAAAHFLVWIESNLPLWGAFALVGSLVAFAGVWLIHWGRTKLDRVAPVPKKSLEALKENLQWKTKN